MAKKQQTGPRARVIDLTDRELLANICDVVDPGEWATSEEIGIACGFSPNGKKAKKGDPTPAMKVASRLAYMRAGKLLESERKEGLIRWRLTSDGVEILKGSTLNKSVTAAIERADIGTQVSIMRELVRAGYLEAEVPRAFAVRRQYQHDIVRRPLNLR